MDKDARINELLAQPVDPSTLIPARNLTLPRSWGVYELHMTRGASVLGVRIGNYPVRGLELEREFGLVRIVGVFTSWTAAEELQRLLNERGKG